MSRTLWVDLHVCTSDIENVSNLSIQRPIEPGGSNEPEGKSRTVSRVTRQRRAAAAFKVRDAGGAKSILDARAKAIATLQED
jgi:hypothetical protein